VKEKSSIFIRAEHRPDLRAALGPDAGARILPSASCFSTFPRSYQFSGCGEKNDKSDKTKEVGKDDKAFREPVRDRGLAVQEGSYQGGTPGDRAYSTIFA
jgi:hypothetical protein